MGALGTGPAATLEEALATNPGSRAVSLYDTDGAAVIGEFAIS